MQPMYKVLIGKRDSLGRQYGRVNVMIRAFNKRVATLKALRLVNFNDGIVMSCQKMGG